MPAYIDVSFSERAQDHSLEGVVQRWVARLEAMSFDVTGAVAAIEPAGRKRTSVCLTVTLGDGTYATATSTHDDACFAVSEAFREVRRDLQALRDPESDERHVAC
jgi:hypothetical protein